MNWRRLKSSMGSSPEPAMPAYSMVRMLWKRWQVLGGDLKRSERAVRRAARHSTVRGTVVMERGAAAGSLRIDARKLTPLRARLASDWLQNTTTSRGPFPPINVFQQGDDILALMELPGIDKNDQRDKESSSASTFGDAPAGLRSRHHRGRRGDCGPPWRPPARE
jgi:hypothetical protein